MSDETIVKTDIKPLLGGVSETAGFNRTTRNFTYLSTDISAFQSNFINDQIENFEVLINDQNGPDGFGLLEERGIRLLRVQRISIALFLQMTVNKLNIASLTEAQNENLAAAKLTLKRITEEEKARSREIYSGDDDWDIFTKDISTLSKLLVVYKPSAEEYPDIITKFLSASEFEHLAYQHRMIAENIAFHSLPTKYSALLPDILREAYAKTANINQHLADAEWPTETPEDSILRLKAKILFLTKIAFAICDLGVLLQKISYCNYLILNRRLFNAQPKFVKDLDLTVDYRCDQYLPYLRLSDDITNVSAYSSNAPSIVESTILNDATSAAAASASLNVTARNDSDNVSITYVQSQMLVANIGERSSSPERQQRASDRPISPHPEDSTIQKGSIGIPRG